MILYIRGENYRSIGESQTISFVANTDKSHNENLIERENLKVLPVIPMYGGNATGKTNLLKLVKTLIELVTGKIEIESAYEPCKFYTEKKETTFEIIFMENNIKYYYKISYTDIEIIEENLYYYPNGKIAKIFVREKERFSFGTNFESELSKYSDNLSNSACFLFTISKFLGEKSVVLNEVNKFFKEKFIFINLDKDSYTLEKSKKLFQVKENRTQIQEFIEYFYKHMNTGASQIHYSMGIKFDKNKAIEHILKDSEAFNVILNKVTKNLELTLHEKEILNLLSIEEDKIYLVYETPKGKIEIPLEEESEGIKKIFVLGMPIVDALCNNKIVIFDELEVGFHPLLSRKIIELFMTKKTRAQLLFTTHNTNLLDLELFRRDQIYFASRTEKTSFMTELKSLGEISGVRKSADIEKAYLEGKYSDAPTYDKFDKEEIGEILC